MLAAAHANSDESGGMHLKCWRLQPSGTATLAALSCDTACWLAQKHCQDSVLKAWNDSDIIRETRMGNSDPCCSSVATSNIVSGRGVGTGHCLTDVISNDESCAWAFIGHKGTLE